MINVILIDSDIKSRKILKELLAKHCPKTRILAVADNLFSGIQSIQKYQPDLVFLDTQLKSHSGFDLLDRIPKANFQIIFTTSVDQFARKAFKYNALDYLLKPIDVNELVNAVNKVVQHAKASLLSTKYRQLETIEKIKFKKIALKVNDGLILVRLKDIIRLESNGHYTTFFTISGEKILISKNIKDYFDLLPKSTFSRPHQSHIVNLDYVKKILREDGGYVIMEDNAKIPISRRKKELFMEALTRRSLS